MARPIFLQTSPTANHVRLVFTTQPSTNYALQTVNNPTQTTWATISNFVGNGKRMTNVVSTGTNRAMQFRIRAQ